VDRQSGKRPQHYQNEGKQLRGPTNPERGGVGKEPTLVTWLKEAVGEKTRVTDRMKTVSQKGQTKKKPKGPGGGTVGGNKTVAIIVLL